MSRIAHNIRVLPLGRDADYGLPAFCYLRSTVHYFFSPVPQSTIFKIKMAGAGIEHCDLMVMSHLRCHFSTLRHSANFHPQCIIDNFPQFGFTFLLKIKRFLKIVLNDVFLP